MVVSRRTVEGQTSTLWPTVTTYLPAHWSNSEATNTEATKTAQRTTHKQTDAMKISATGTKSSPDSRVGIGFASHAGGKIILTNIIETSLFHGSDLRVGHEIVSVNGTVVRGMDVYEIKAMLASIEKEVNIQAQSVPQSYTLESTIAVDGVNVSLEKPDLPVIFKSKNVPRDEWDQIFAMFKTEIVPRVHYSLKLDKLLETEFKGFVGSQMIRGAIGFGTESAQEKQVFMMTHQAAIQHSNLSMTASNVLMEINAMVNPYGIRARLVFTEQDLPKIPGLQSRKNNVLIPTGIKFIAPADP